MNLISYQSWYCYNSNLLKWNSSKSYLCFHFFCIQLAVENWPISFLYIITSSSWAIVAAIFRRLWRYSRIGHIQLHLGYLSVHPLPARISNFGQLLTWSGGTPLTHILDVAIVIPFENSFLLFWPSEFLSLSLFGIGYKITHFGSGCELLLNCIASSTACRACCIEL